MTSAKPARVQNDAVFNKEGGAILETDEKKKLLGGLYFLESPAQSTRSGLSKRVSFRNEKEREKKMDAVYHLQGRERDGEIE
ncbi:hypothetical protein NPIL_357111 [Nephila pilipes]|uniref:Uncharacterized protein n=1 Tax=Nephila pilipes TaxID=299642 RepID=A0A8X6UBI2_NEPPI|nr:hypothetical protein NPIL_357111 [Nephila pilipes]